VTSTELSVRVQAALDSQARSRLQSHYGDIEVDSISDDGDVGLRFLGSCTSCPLRPMTFVATILPLLDSLEGVRSVRVKGLLLSDRTIERIRASVGTNASDVLG
jgi:Fe-S cluster biogenesis protein NfuA